MSFLTLILSLFALHFSPSYNFPDFKTPEFVEMLQFKNISNYNIERIYSLENGDPCVFVFDGENDSLIFNINDNRLIYEVEGVFDSPFSLSESTTLKLFYIAKTVSFLCSDGNYFWESGSEFKFKITDYVSQSARSITGFSDNFTQILNENLIPSDFVLIPEYRFFTRLRSNHAKNPNNLCSLIAIEIMMSFYDSFYDDNFIKDDWDLVSRTVNSNIIDYKNWEQSPGSGYQNGDDDIKSELRDHLHNLACECPFPGSLISRIGATRQTAVDILQKYLTDSLSLYSSEYILDSFDNCALGNSQLVKNHIENQIDLGFPVLISAGNHWVVAFGYSDDYLLVHDGYGGFGKMEYYICWTDISPHDPATIIFNPVNNHSHCNNYFSLSTNKFYCSCGYENNYFYSPNNFVFNTLDFITFNSQFNFQYVIRNVSIVGDGFFDMMLNSEIWIKPVYLFDAFSLEVTHYYGANSEARLIIEYYDIDYNFIRNVNFYDYMNFTNGQKSSIPINLSSNPHFIKIAIQGGLTDKIRIHKLTLSV